MWLKWTFFFQVSQIEYLNSEVVSVVFHLEKSESQVGCEIISLMGYLQIGGQIGRNFGNQH